MMKKILSLIIAALLAFAIAAPIFADDDTDAPLLGAGVSDDAESKDGESSDGEGILTTGEDVVTTGEDAESGQSAEDSDPIVVSVEGAPDYTVKPDEYYLNYDFSEIFDENGHFKDLIASDYVQPNNYDPLNLSREELDGLVEDEINSLLEEYAGPEKLTDKVIEEGDRVNIDYVGSVDGVEFSGGSTNGMGTTVEIGVTTYIDDFIDQLIGHKPGETFDVEVTFPEVYDKNPDLEGKDAVFAVTINYVEGEDVTPELTEEFIAENITPSLPDVTTPEELRNFIATNENFLSGIIVEKLSTENEFSEIPEKVYGFAVDLVLMNLYSQAVAYGMDVETILSVSGMSLEDLIESYGETNLNIAKRMLVVQAIDETRDDISVTEEAMTEFAVENLGTDDYTEAVEQYGVGLYKMYVLQDVVLNYIIDHLDTPYQLVNGDDAAESGDQTESGAENPEGSKNDGLSKAILIVCIVVGALIIVLLVVLIAFEITKNRKKEDIDANVGGGSPRVEPESGNEEKRDDGMISLSDVLDQTEEVRQPERLSDAQARQYDKEYNGDPDEEDDDDEDENESEDEDKSEDEE